MIRPHTTDPANRHTNEGKTSSVSETTSGRQISVRQIVEKFNQKQQDGTDCSTTVTSCLAFKRKIDSNLKLLNLQMNSLLQDGIMGVDNICIQVKNCLSDSEIKRYLESYATGDARTDKNIREEFPLESTATNENEISVVSNRKSDIDLKKVVRTTELSVEIGFPTKETRPETNDNQPRPSRGIADLAEVLTKSDKPPICKNHILQSLSTSEDCEPKIRPQIKAKRMTKKCNTKRSNEVNEKIKSTNVEQTSSDSEEHIQNTRKDANSNLEKIEQIEEEYVKVMNSLNVVEQMMTCIGHRTTKTSDFLQEPPKALESTKVTKIKRSKHINPKKIKDEMEKECIKEDEVIDLSKIPSTDASIGSATDLLARNDFSVDIDALLESTSNCIKFTMEDSFLGDHQSNLVGGIFSSIEEFSVTESDENLKNERKRYYEECVSGTNSSEEISPSKKLDCRYNDESAFYQINVTSSLGEFPEKSLTDTGGHSDVEKEIDIHESSFGSLTNESNHSDDNDAEIGVLQRESFEDVMPIVDHNEVKITARAEDSRLQKKSAKKVDDSDDDSIVEMTKKPKAKRPRPKIDRQNDECSQKTKYILRTSKDRKPQREEITEHFANNVALPDCSDDEQSSIMSTVNDLGALMNHKALDPAMQVLKQCRKMMDDLLVPRDPDNWQRVWNGTFNPSVIEGVLDHFRKVQWHHGRPNLAALTHPVNVEPNVHRKLGVCDINGRMEYQTKATDSFAGFLKLMNRTRRKQIIHRAERQDQNTKFRMKYLPKHAAPKRSIMSVSSVLTTASTIASSVPDPPMAKKTIRDRTHELTAKYVNSLWFSAKDFKPKPNRKQINKRLDLFCKQIAGNHSATLQKQKKTCHGGHHVKGCNCVMVQTLSSKRPYFQKTSTNHMVPLRTTKAIPKRELNFCDILDDLSIRDLEPFHAEYPRKDEILSFDEADNVVQSSLLYKLVYAKKESDSRLKELVQPTVTSWSKHRVRISSHEKESEKSYGKVSSKRARPEPRRCDPSKPKTSTIKLPNSAQPSMTKTAAQLFLHNVSELKPKKMKKIKRMLAKTRRKLSERHDKQPNIQHPKSDSATFQQLFGSEMVCSSPIVATQMNLFPRNKTSQKGIYQTNNPVSKYSTNKLIPYILDPEAKVFQTLTVMPVKIYFDNQPFLPKTSQGGRFKKRVCPVEQGSQQETIETNKHSLRTVKSDRPGQDDGSSAAGIVWQRTQQETVETNKPSPRSVKSDRSEQNEGSSAQGEQINKKRVQKSSVINSLHKTEKNASKDSVSITKKHSSKTCANSGWNTPKGPKTEQQRKLWANKYAKTVGETLIKFIENQPTLNTPVAKASLKPVPKKKNLDKNSKTPNDNRGELHISVDAVRKHRIMMDRLKQLKQRNSKLQDNIQRAITIIENKMLDLLSCPESKRNSKAFNDIETDIIQVLELMQTEEKGKKRKISALDDDKEKWPSSADGRMQSETKICDPDPLVKEKLKKIKNTYEELPLNRNNLEHNSTESKLRKSSSSVILQIIDTHHCRRIESEKSVKLADEIPISADSQAKVTIEIEGRHDTDVSTKDNDVKTKADDVKTKDNDFRRVEENTDANKNTDRIGRVKKIKKRLEKKMSTENNQKRPIIISDQQNIPKEIPLQLERTTAKTQLSTDVISKTLGDSAEIAPSDRVFPDTDQRVQNSIPSTEAENRYSSTEAEFAKFIAASIDNECESGENCYPQIDESSRPLIEELCSGENIINYEMALTPFQGPLDRVVTNQARKSKSPLSTKCTVNSSFYQIINFLDTLSSITEDKTTETSHRELHVMWNPEKKTSIHGAASDMSLIPLSSCSGTTDSVVEIRKRATWTSETTEDDVKRHFETSSWVTDDLRTENNVEPTIGTVQIKVVKTISSTITTEETKEKSVKTFERNKPAQNIEHFKTTRIICVDDKHHATVLKYFYILFYTVVYIGLATLDYKCV